MTIGGVMQVVVLIVQKDVPHTELGVATSGATFFRSIDGSFGAIFSQDAGRQPGQPGARVALPPGLSSANVARPSRSPWLEWPPRPLLGPVLVGVTSVPVLTFGPRGGPNLQRISPVRLGPEGGNVAAKSTVPASAGKPPRRRPRRPSSTTVIAIVNCALVGVTTVFLTTRSVPVTVIAAAAAVLLVGLAVVRS